MKDSEESFELGAGWSWAILILFCLAILGWGFLNFALIQDRPRAWDFGALQDTPGQSIYSTEEPAGGQAPVRQMPPLPEANPQGASGAPSQPSGPEPGR